MIQPDTHNRNRWVLLEIAHTDLDFEGGERVREWKKHLLRNMGQSVKHEKFDILKKSPIMSVRKAINYLFHSIMIKTEGK